ncbi:hypothetical protein DOTSEDRAFT_74808 [Dothistroma septosporum NZE10]|uniref:Uncharacterized protein n=1 Tax=Dothistroma septosporum (strain NZE10 / CBS 128990) TaxID=675120 RepID=N1PFJ3_DOTSN|nr:hypothetical protein DOTSEDRAFT_74808 [Dothistroma septosporum NZE10]
MSLCAGVDSGLAGLACLSSARRRRWMVETSTTSRSAQPCLSAYPSILACGPARDSRPRPHTPSQSWPTPPLCCAALPRHNH